MAEDNTTRGIRVPEEQPNGYFPKGKNYLLIIGIDQYQNFPRLYNAVKDAKDVKEILVNNYQFEDHPATTSLLLDQDATQANIYAELDQLAQKVGPDDNLLIYFSGHGEYKENLDTGFWIPVDADEGNIGSYLQFGLLQLYIKAIKSHHTVLIADSCYAGSIFTTRSTGSYQDRLERKPSRWLITAGRNEVVADGKPGMNSPFADAILFTLKDNTNKRLEVSQLARQVAELVSKNAAQTPRYAEMFGVNSKGGEFMFRLKAFAKTAFEPLEKKKEEGREPEVFRGSEEVKKTEMKKTYQNIKEIEKDAQKLIALNEIDDAFQLMDQIIDEDNKFAYNFILLKSRYHSFKQAVKKDESSEKELRRQLNSIKNPFLSYISQLEEDKPIKNSIFGKLARINFKKYEEESQKVVSGISSLEKSSLQSEAEQLVRQIAFYRTELNSAYDTAKKFSLSEDIRKLEERLTEIKTKLGE
ncbi:MAG: caspase family protein [Saprospiraceae bacterium]|nr:caspase family protein [Saprospiraceae bacterium]